MGIMTKARRRDRAKLKARMDAELKDYYEQKIDKSIELETLAAAYDSTTFFNSNEWKQLRYRALKTHGARCATCGRTPRDGVIIHVDHILPRSIYPELAFNFNNLQVLCSDCNEGKSNKDTTDWRPKGVIVESTRVLNRHKDCKIYKCPNKIADVTGYCLDHVKKSSAGEYSTAKSVKSKRVIYTQDVASTKDLDSFYGVEEPIKSGILVDLQSGEDRETLTNLVNIKKSISSLYR